MDQKRLIKFLNGLMTRTEAGTLNWEQTSSEGTFQLAFPEYTVRIMQLSSQEGYHEEWIELRIYNEDSRLVEKIAYSELPDEGLITPRVAFLDRLYEGARHKAMGVDKALDDLIGALEDEKEDSR